MNTTILDSMLRRQEIRLEKQKRLSREKIEKGKSPTKSFSLERQDVLLRPHENYSKDWFFCVPPYFNDALDIRLMERVEVKNYKVVRRYVAWTQGSLFSFSAGDAVYDIPFEKNRPWSEDLKNLGICLQIEKASPVDLIGEGDNAYRFPGNIECTVLTPSEDRQRIIKRGQVSMTQDEFVRVLITGPNEKISPFLNTPKFDANGQGLLF